MGKKVKNLDWEESEEKVKKVEEVKEKLNLEEVINKNKKSSQKKKRSGAYSKQKGKNLIK